MSFPYAALVRSFRRWAAVAALLTLVVTGCGGYGDVSGKVTHKGKTLVWGTVQFEGSDKMVKQGNINTDGTYSISGVATGEAKAAVSSINPKSSDFQLRRPQEGGPRANPRTEVKGWFPIPQKYDTTFKSGLSYTIKAGENKIDIDLP
jgi:hypothetical protein